MAWGVWVTVAADEGEGKSVTCLAPPKQFPTLKLFRTSTLTFAKAFVEVVLSSPWAV